MQYGNDGICVWKVYGIGFGKLILVNKVQLFFFLEILIVVIILFYFNIFVLIKVRLIEKRGEELEKQLNVDCELVVEEDV